MRTRLEELAALTLFAYVGYAIRFGTERFTESSDALTEGGPIYTDFYANIVGCLWCAASSRRPVGKEVIEVFF